MKIRESIDIRIFMKNQLHVGMKADLGFNLGHFWPMKSFRRPRFWRKTDCFFKISDAIHIYEINHSIFCLKKLKFDKWYNLYFVVFSAAQIQKIFSHALGYEENIILWKLTQCPIFIEPLIISSVFIFSKWGTRKELIYFYLKLHL